MRGRPKPFYRRARWKKCQCVWWLVYVCAVYVCVCKQDPEVWSGQRGPVYSVPRVGVLGWLRPMVLHNHPAKSTSSTSDRLMNVWLWKKTKREIIVCAASIINTKDNNPVSKLSDECRQSSGTHHQHLQICSLSRVFDQTAHTQMTPKMLMTWKKSVNEGLSWIFFLSNNLRSH